MAIPFHSRSPTLAPLTHIPIHVLTAVVLCSPTLRNYFINYARPLIYSTVMPQILVTTISCSLAHLESGLADQVGGAVLTSQA